MKKNNILVIADTQIPFEHKEYAKFCKAVQRKYKCGRVIHIGDVLDCFNWSAYDKAPEGPSPSEEIKAVQKSMAKWGRMFPKVEAVVGNHDNRIRTRLKSAGFPEWSLPYKQVLRQVYGIPDGWSLHDSIHTNTPSGRISFMHGDERGGSRVAGKTAQLLGNSVVRGHMHSKAFVHLHALHGRVIFDMVVGCGIDNKAVAFEYNKKDLLLPVLSCGVILDGTPIVIPMVVNKRNKWNGRV